MEIKDRIKLIIEKENITAGIFADNIGVQQSTLSHVINDRNKPSLDVVMKIHQRYSYINLEWLLYGTGEMVTANSSKHLAHSAGHHDHSSSSNNASTPKYSENFPSLFNQNPEKTGVDPEDYKNRREIALETPKENTKHSVIQEIKYIEKPSRKITEIRIFFDDNTYETFKGEK